MSTSILVIVRYINIWYCLFFFVSTRGGRCILIFELVGHDMLLLDQVRWV